VPKNEKPRLAAGPFRFLFARSAVLLVLLATLLLAGLLLAAALPAAALLLTTLLLARLLVRILIHFTFLFNIGLKRHAPMASGNARPLYLFPCTCTFNFKTKRIWNLA
jgi:hypothetical protein